MDASTPWSAGRLLIDIGSEAASSTRIFRKNGLETAENAGIWSIRGPVGYRNATEGRIEFKRQEINRWLKSLAISLPAW
jgi:hypothetical protein